VRSAHRERGDVVLTAQGGKDGEVGVLGTTVSFPGLKGTAEGSIEVTEAQGP